jgi:hypothetical protein
MPFGLWSLASGQSTHQMDQFRRRVAWYLPVFGEMCALEGPELRLLEPEPATLSNAYDIYGPRRDHPAPRHPP